MWFDAEKLRLDRRPTTNVGKTVTPWSEHPLRPQSPPPYSVPRYSTLSAPQILLVRGTIDPRSTRAALQHAGSSTVDVLDGPWVLRYGAPLYRDLPSSLIIQLGSPNTSRRPFSAWRLFPIAPAERKLQDGRIRPPSTREAGSPTRFAATVRTPEGYLY